METLAPVNLDLKSTRAVVESQGGCVVWGGAVRLSPADDVLVRVERPLDLDGTSQLVASVLSKRVAAGSQRVLIDIPVGFAVHALAPFWTAALALVAGAWGTWRWWGPARRNVRGIGRGTGDVPPVASRIDTRTPSI